MVTDPSVIYVIGGEVVAVAAGDVDHSDALTAAGASLVADLGDGTWVLLS